MRVLKIEGVNYRQFDRFELAPSDGTTVIIGKNGSGKSNTLGTLLFLLTGQSPSQGKRKTRLLKRGATEGYVKGDVEFDGIVFSITRWLHKSDARMTWTDGGEQSLSKITQVTEKLSELLGGADAETLLMAAFMAQKSDMKLIFGTDVERFKEYSRLLRLSRLERLRDRMAKISIPAYPPTVDSDMAEVSNVLITLNTDKKAREVQLIETRAEITRLAPMVTYTKDSLTKSAYDAKVADLETTIAAISEQLDKAPAYSEADKLVVPTDEEHTLSRHYEAALAMGRRVVSLEEELVAAEKTLPAEGPFDEAKFERMLEQRFTLQLKHNFNIMGECSICLTKKAPAGATKESASRNELIKIDTDILAAKAIRAGKAAAIGEATGKIEYLGKELAKATAEFTRLSTMVENFDPADYATKSANLRVKADGMRADQNRLVLETRLAEKNLDLKNTRAIGFVDDSTKATYDRYQGALNRERQLELELARDDGSIKSTTERLAALTRDSELKKITDAQRMFIDRARDLLHVDNIPRHIAVKHAADLAVAANKYLSSFRQDFAVTIDKNLEVVCDFGGVAGGVDELSGGQQTVLSVAFRMAIAEVFMGCMPFLALDEPTAWLDPDNRGALINALALMKECLNARSVQMFVCTNDDALIAVGDKVVRIGGTND